MPARSPFLLALSLCSFLALTSCSRFDHHTSSDLQRELVDRSKHGLVLARSLLPALEKIEIRYFDGHTEIVQPICCTKIESIGLSRSRLVVVDAPPKLDLWRGQSVGLAQSTLSYGGPVVVMDMRGQVIARSKAEFWPGEVAISPNGKQFAIISTPRGLKAETGLYVGCFADAHPRRIADLEPPAAADTPYSMQTMVDWSPNGQTLLLSHQGAISAFELAGASRKIADGSSALWSPSGELISFITPQWEHAILNVSTGARTLIDKGNQGGTPLEWSPDGKYLLVPEGANWLGYLWVYRVADSAWYPIPDHYGLAGPHPRWVELPN